MTDVRGDEEDAWSAGWDEDAAAKRAAWAQTTPAERLAWLESALTFAESVGALREDRRRRAAEAAIWDITER